LQAFYRKDREKGFNLAGGPLIRLSLLKTGGNSYRLVWSFHHILMDGWCLGIVFKDLLYIYRGLRKGVPVSLTPVARYRNYIKWLKGQDSRIGMEYWQNYLDGYEQQVELPHSHEMQPGDTYRLEEYTICLDEVLSGRLKTLSANCRVTINTVMQAAWGILLQRYNNSDDVVFGAVTSGRPPHIEGIESMVGLFINTLPVRVKTVDKQPFVRLLQEIQADAVSSRAYEYLALADIQARSLLKGALIDHIMVFENYPLDQEIKNSLNPGEYGFTVTDLWAYEQTNYDFNISISQLNSLAIKFSYNASVFTREWVERTWGYLNNILMQIVEKSGLEVEKIEIMTDEERHRILFEFNDTTAAYPGDKTIHRLFAEQAARMPDRIALVGADPRVCPALSVCPVCLTYRELHGQSNRLAGLLVEKGVLVGDIVGIMVHRSIEMIIGIYGILKAGGAYLPIDPHYPQERIDYMLKDSGARILITKSEIRNLKSRVVSNFEFRASDLISSNLAYIIYTSGSTGKPKGVMIEHRSVVNILSALFRQYPFAETDCFLAKTSFTFDVSVSELFGWFWGGGRMALPAAGVEKDPEQIIDAVERYRVTHIDFVPSLFGVFIEVLKNRSIKKIVSLKYIFIAGEALPPSLVGRFRELNSDVRLENLYGPTEGTVYAGGYSLAHWVGGVNVPIGKPLQNVRLYILDRYDRLRPVGAAGELCIAG
ncbi:MAG TPA: condensation domain-containing protein, partial [Candidatus Deferrimicrobium sp.]|nr:condensation domain-containing protein [Candidatus Deferrimicrobium sp.]